VGTLHHRDEDCDGDASLYLTKNPWNLPFAAATNHRKWWL
jgi:hypothetical protein